MISEIYAIIAGMLTTIIVMLIMIKKKYKASYMILTAVFIMYVTGVICMTFFPINYVKTIPDDFDLMENTVKLIPFEVILYNIRYEPIDYIIVQIGGNILMTVPFGIMLPLLYRTKKKYIYPLICFCLTAAIECLQFLIGFLLNTFYRTSDIDDIILNFTGAVIGLLICRFLPERIKKRFESSH